MASTSDRSKRLGWVTASFWIGALALLPAVLVGDSSSVALGGAALVLIGATHLYEGMAIGRMRGMYGPDAVRQSRPVGYALIALAYAFTVVVGALFVMIAVFGWPHAV